MAGNSLFRFIPLLIIGMILSGCNEVLTRIVPPENVDWTTAYAAKPQERFPLPAIKVGQVPKNYRRSIVPYYGSEKPGTVIVDTKRRYLLLVRKDGWAMRYGIGIGRQGFAWNGSAKVGAKRKWPTWTPPAEMMARQPETREFAGGMPPSLSNPLGARALYLYDNGVDTLYRIHGTNEPRSIGKAVSSGCIRMFNQDVIDLYNRVPVGAKVVVI